VTAPSRDGAIHLALDEYRMAWRHLGLGLPHWNLDPPGGAERTAEERAMQDQQAWEGLQQRRLVAGRGLVPQLEDALHLLARAPEEINGKIDSADGRVHLVAAARGGFGVVAELYREGLRLRFARGSALAAATIAPLPDRPPIPGSAVSAPSDALAVDTGLTGVQVEQALVQSGVRSIDARTFRAMIKGPRLLGAKFGAAWRDQRSRRHASEFVVSYFATERGGYTVEQRRGADRRPWITVAPAGKGELAQRLDRLVGSR